MADFAAADRDVDVLLLVDDEADVVEGSRPADKVINLFLVVAGEETK